MGRTHVWPEDVKAFVSQWYRGGQESRACLFWDYLMHGIMWGVWKEGNKRLFEEVFKSKEEVIGLYCV